MQPDSSGGPQPSRTASLFANLPNHITKIGTIAGAFVAITTVFGAAVGYALKPLLYWQISEFVANDPRFVESFVTAVKSELAKPKDKLSGAFDELLQKQRAGEVGALTAGSFLMRKDRVSYTLYMYLPKGHTGSLNLSVDWWPKGNQSNKDLPFITVQFPEGRVVSIKKGGTYQFDLPNLIPSGPTLASVEREFVAQPSTGPLDSLYAITFQAGGEVQEGSAEIKFAAFVHPTIRIESKK